MGIEYTAEKLANAANALATGPGSLRERLFTAWLACHTLNPDASEDFPTKELAGRFRTLLAEISALPARGDEGKIQATLAAASEDDLRRWAEEILSMHTEVTEINARHGQ